MQKLDAPQMAKILGSLAEAFDRKAIGTSGLEVWFDTLREFPTHAVFVLLQSWPKTHGKFPVPAEIWKILNDSATQERERKAKADKAEFARGIEKMEKNPSHIFNITDPFK